MFDPRPLIESPWPYLGRVFTSIGPARNIVQALAYRCLPPLKLKNDISWHTSYFFNVQRDISNMCHKLQPGH